MALSSHCATVVSNFLCLCVQGQNWGRYKNIWYTLEKASVFSICSWRAKECMQNHLKIMLSWHPWKYPEARGHSGREVMNANYRVINYMVWGWNKQMMFRKNLQSWLRTQSTCCDDARKGQALWINWERSSDVPLWLRIILEKQCHKLLQIAHASTQSQGEFSSHGDCLRSQGWSNFTTQQDGRGVKAVGGKFGVISYPYSFHTLEVERGQL